MSKEKQEAGFVYILTNPSFREDLVKIGKSSRLVDVRSKELDNTEMPLPFEIFATMETAKYNEVERLGHKTIDRLTDLRDIKSSNVAGVESITCFWVQKNKLIYYVHLTLMQSLSPRNF